MPGQQSEWHSSLQEFERIDIILKNIDEHVFRIHQRDNSAIEGYYACLRTFWKNIEPIVDAPPIRKDILDRFGRVETKINLWLEDRDEIRKKQFQRDIVKDLDALHAELLHRRQTLGMGVKTYRKLSERTAVRRKMREIMGGGNGSSPANSE